MLPKTSILALGATGKSMDLTTKEDNGRNRPEAYIETMSSVIDANFTLCEQPQLNFLEGWKW